MTFKFFNRSRIFSFAFVVLVLAHPTTVHSYSNNNQSDSNGTIALMLLVSIIVSNTIEFHYKNAVEQERIAAEEYRVFSQTRKECFARTIEKELTDYYSDAVEKRYLEDYAKYRYQNYVEAIKEAFPNGYSEHIRTLKLDLDLDYKKRMIPGFKAEKKGWFTYTKSDYYEFYELIKTLNTEIEATEKKQFSTIATKLKKDQHDFEKKAGISELKFNTF